MLKISSLRLRRLEINENLSLFSILFQKDTYYCFQIK